MVDALRASPAAVLIGQQHPVVPENKIVQEAVKVDSRHIGSGVIGTLPRAAGEGLVGILLAIFAVFGINTSIGESVNFGNIGGVILMVLMIASLLYFSLKKKKKA